MPHYCIKDESWGASHSSIPNGAIVVRMNGPRYHPDGETERWFQYEAGNTDTRSVWMDDDMLPGGTYINGVYTAP